jgi:hypothetical protein
MKFGWLPCHMLLEFAGSNGSKPVRLCDFASAGLSGRHYRSWLPLQWPEGKGVPTAPFSKQKPGRTFIVSDALATLATEPPILCNADADDDIVMPRGPQPREDNIICSPCNAPRPATTASDLVIKVEQGGAKRRMRVTTSMSFVDLLEVVCVARGLEEERVQWLDDGGDWCELSSESELAEARRTVVKFSPPLMRLRVV